MSRRESVGDGAVSMILAETCVRSGNYQCGERAARARRYRAIFLQPYRNDSEASESMDTRDRLDRFLILQPQAASPLSCFRGRLPDPAIAEALSLVGHEAPTWGQIYDIIEFLGGPSSVKKAGFASKHKAAHMKRTANHYRHLGNPEKYPLPPNPSTLAEARMFAIDLVIRWIAERIRPSQ
jgi:hypothetical protein